MRDMAKADVGSVIDFHGRAVVGRRHAPWNAQLRLDRALHEGGAARPFVVTRLSDGERFVLKLCDKPVDDVRRLLVETAVGSSHAHPNLLRVFAYGNVGDVPAIIAEYIQGQDLYSFLEERSGPLPFDLFQLICVHVLRGLVALHRKNIVHRDIKLENIMLQIDESGNVVRAVIIDFGIARDTAVETRLTQPGTALGTLAFMAPEQFHAASVTNVRTDIWAFCILMLRLLRSPHPFGVPYDAGFGSLGMLARAYMHPDDSRAIRILAPYAAETILRLEVLAIRCLQHDPDRRLSAADLLQCLGNLQDAGEPHSGVVSRVLQQPREIALDPQGRAPTLQSVRPSPPSEVVVVAPAHQLPIPPSALSRSSWMWLVAIILLAMIAVTLIVIAATLFSRSPPI